MSDLAWAIVSVCILAEVSMLVLDYGLSMLRFSVRST